jgi:hypothetical protein
MAVVLVLSLVLYLTSLQIVKIIQSDGSRMNLNMELWCDIKPKY